MQCQWNKAVKFQADYSTAFEGGEEIPEHIQTDEDMIFHFMIHELKRMGYHRAGRKKIIDFYKATYHENQKNQREKYLFELKNPPQ